MLKRVPLLLLVSSLASAASADTLSNVKSALAKLTATQTVRATYSARNEVKSAGKFDNSQSARDTAFEIVQDAAGVHVTIPAALVKRAGAEAKALDSKDTSARSAVGGIQPLEIVDAIDFRDSLLGLLAIGKVTEEKSGAFNGRTVRLLVLKLTQPERKSGGEVRLGKSSREEDRLTLWLGDDDVPLGAERVTKTKGGFLIFRYESSSKVTHVFGRRGDRFYLARSEETGAASGMGQKIDSKAVMTLTVQ